MVWKEGEKNWKWTAEMNNLSIKLHEIFSWLGKLQIANYDKEFFSKSGWY